MDPQNNQFQNNFGTPYAYNNVPQQPMPVQPQSVPNVRGISAIAEVYGPDGVDRYPVVPGTTVLLIQWLTQNSGKFWLKSKDMYGRPIPLLEFTFGQNLDPSMVSPQQPMSGTNAQPNNQAPVQPFPNQNDFVNKKDFDELRGMVAELHAGLVGQSTSGT